MPRSKVLYFIRHGESISNVGGTTMVHKAIPLTERGYRQAKFIAGQLNVNPHQVLVSEHIRTQETARPYCEKYSHTPVVDSLLNEFSALSHELIAGMNGKERRPLANAYWHDADIHRRMGDFADTFTEFNQRVFDFKARMGQLSNHTVIFGHGIWFGLLVWQLMGFEVFDSLSMKAFRRFQTGLPLSNGMVYRLISNGSNNWRVQADKKLLQAYLLDEH